MPAQTNQATATATLESIVNSQQVLIVGCNESKHIAAAAKLDADNLQGDEIKNMVTAFIILIINMMKESGTSKKDAIEVIGLQLSIAVKNVYADPTTAASTAVH